MTKMVFAVTGRGKTKGQTATSIEVGSWVIGYWRPQMHFEVNVWNCFERRTSKLLAALKLGDPLTKSKVAGTFAGFASEYGAGLFGMWRLQNSYERHS